MEAVQALRDLGRPEKVFWVFTFDPFLTETPFIPRMRRMLEVLEKTYENPVDIEFTVNFTAKGEMQINLLQCRPFQTLGIDSGEGLPETISKEKTIIRLEGNFMGGSISRDIGRIIFVDPGAYVTLSVSERYSVARLVGKLNKLTAHKDEIPTLLMGPGRWGTHSPSMGVPVNFSEINHVAVMAEISYQSGSLIPDLSFGTHFFHDLIETGIFYLAVYPESPEVVFNLEWIQQQKNQLASLVPESSRLGHVVKVCDTRRSGLKFQSDVVNQKVMCYIAR
jgi:hypothetical protein